MERLFILRKLSVDNSDQLFTGWRMKPLGEERRRLGEAGWGGAREGVKEKGKKPANLFKGSSGTNWKSWYNSSRRREGENTHTNHDEIFLMKEISNLNNCCVGHITIKEQF